MAKLASNPEKLAEYQFGLSCEKAIQGTSIALIKKTDKQSFDYIFGKLLVLCADSITVNNKFGLAQVPAYREAIFNKYYFLTIDEIAYVLKNIITGVYKKEYNKLDLETLMNAFEIYDTSERMQWLDKRNHNENIEALKLKESFKGISSEFASEMVKKISAENNLTTIDSEKAKEEAYKKERLKWISERKKK